MTLYLFPAPTLLGAEQRIDDAHASHCVLHAVRKGDLAADGPRECLALQLVLVTLGQRLGTDRGAVQRRPVVQEQQCPRPLRRVDGDLDLDAALGPAEVRPLEGNALSRYREIQMATL